MKWRQGATSLAILGIAMLATLAVFRLPIGPSLQLMFQGALGDRFGLSRTAVKATPLMLTGLGMVVAWRGGIYNIGGEGQFIIGGLAGACVATLAPHGSSGVEAALFIALILAACACGGAFWAWIAGWLYVRRGVEAVVSTIMLNFIAIEILDWAVSGPLQEAKHQVPLTQQLPDALMLPKLNHQMDLHAGVLIALLAAIAIQIFLFYTKQGFWLRLVGDSPQVARANSISVSREQIRATILSGALCGLAGGIEYTGMTGQLGAGFSQQWGFLGIPVALLAGLNPLAVIAWAIAFGALFAGSENLARFTASGTTIVYVIQATAVLALVATQTLPKRATIRRPKENLGAPA